MPGALAPGKNLRPSFNILKRPPRTTRGRHAINRGRNLLKHGFRGVKGIRDLRATYARGSRPAPRNRSLIKERGPRSSDSTCPESAGPEMQCCAYAANNGAGVY